MKVIQTEDSSFVRDIHSKALLTTDRSALENHRRRRQIEIQQAKKWEQLENKVEELNNVKDEILEIRSLLQELLNKREL
tara:strand:- start:385 stop:621 length:237 start_codon:yes stop_codon:yes gene_type:complete